MIMSTFAMSWQSDKYKEEKEFAAIKAKYLFFVCLFFCVCLVYYVIYEWPPNIIVIVVFLLLILYVFVSFFRCVCKDDYVEPKIW